MILPYRIRRLCKPCLSFIFFLSFYCNTASSQDTCGLRISILTATPGEELYSTFGHSAIRVIDSVRQQDYVFNYGTFNFEEPNFYLKFVRGKLPFYLSVDNFNDFISEYQQDNRGVTEQILHLNCYQKRRIYALLSENMIGPNRSYKYDFTFDNCTTRLRDLLEKATDSSVHFGNTLEKPATFRDLIYVYLNRNDKQWSKLGIDILLGSRMDKTANQYQAMFLPDYLMYAIDEGTLDGHRLVHEKISLVRINHEFHTKENLSHPLFVFLCLFVLIAFLGFSKNPSVQKILASFDKMLIFITGLLGILLLFMWFGTDHYMCKANYNLLWAWPMNIVAAFYMHSNRRWPKIYFGIYGLCLLIVMLLWKAIPQHFNTALVPVALLLIWRCGLYTFRKK